MGSRLIQQRESTQTDQTSAHKHHQLLMFGVTGQISQNMGGRKRMMSLTTISISPSRTSSLPGKIMIIAAL